MDPSRPILGEQFDDLDQQHQTATLGMWAFLATEIMFFGGLFTAFTVYRSHYPAAFAEGSRHLSFTLGGINSALLLFSSLLTVLAVSAARAGDNRRTVRLLLATIGLATIFLCIKGTEYYLEYRDRLVPGVNFEYAGPLGRMVELFFCFYFIMTSLHAAHMVVGMGILGFVAIMAGRRRFSTAYSNPVEIAALYWSFVDIVWIFLYPLLYLLRY